MQSHVLVVALRKTPSTTSFEAADGDECGYLGRHFLPTEVNYIVRPEREQAEYRARSRFPSPLVLVPRPMIDPVEPCSVTTAARPQLRARIAEGRPRNARTEGFQEGAAASLDLSSHKTREPPR